RALKVQNGASAAELRATDQVVKLELRNAELEKQTENLRQRLSLLQQAKPGGGNAGQRDSGLPSGRARPRGGPNTRVLYQPPQQQQQSMQMQRDQRQRSLGRSEDMRNERTQLQMANERLESELDALKDKLYAQEMEHQRRIQDLQSELDLARMQAGTDKRSAMQEDLDKVRLQRELREKSAIIEQLQARCEQHEERMRETVETNSRFLEELERMKRELRAREREAESMKESAGSAQATRRRLMELEHALEDANKEANILREANEKLTNSAFDTERERQWKARELALMTQIQQLEATMHRDVGEKGEFLDRLEDERNKGEEVEKELSNLRIKFYELQQKHESLREKMKFINKEGAVDLDEVEEAIVLVKQRRQQQQPSELDFLHQVDAEVSKDNQRRLREIEAAHSDTIQELDKTRQLLEAQYRINQDLKASLSLTERRLEAMKADHDAKMAESAKLLDIRAARIRKLERQLRDVAYGTKQFALLDQQNQLQSEEADGVDEIDETVHLQNGENLVELHVGRLTLTDEGIQLLGGDSNPSLFCTWPFYVCELQTTDVLRAAGGVAEFNKTVQYVVKVDDSFLHYINKEKARLELYHSVGVTYHQVAACRLYFRELLDSKPTAPVSGRAQLVSVDGGTVVGCLDYWMRMRVPMEQAMRLYRERAKALGYMSANHQAAAEGLKALDDLAQNRRAAGGANTLGVKIVRCRGLKARRPDFQPTPYCSYKFFDCEDTVSPAIPNSSDPEFQFYQQLTLTPTPELDRYLKTQKLVVWVLDEDDPLESAYLGVAKIDLVSLSQNRAVQGIYQLLGADQQPNGTLELELSWQFAYNPAGHWDGPAEPLPLMTGEAELLRDKPQLKHRREPGYDSTLDRSAAVALGSDTGSARSTQQRPQPQQPQPQPVQQPRTPRRGTGSASGSSHGPSPTASAVAPNSASGSSSPRPSARTGSRSGSLTGDNQPQVSQTPQPPKRHAPSAAALAAAAAERRLGIGGSGGAGDTQASQTRVSTLMDASVTDSVTSITDTQDVRNTSLGPSVGRSGVASHQQSVSLRDDNYDVAEAEPKDEVEEVEYEDDYEDTERPAPEAEESDGVVTESSHGDELRQQLMLTATGRASMEACTVQIFNVQFSETCQALRNPDLDDTKCYVFFLLPGFSQEETETPVSLWTPRPGQSRPNEFCLSYNFQRVYDYSFAGSYEKRKVLAMLLLGQKSIEIPFTVVCEPSDPESEFFVDLGKTMVNLDDRIAQGEDIREEIFPLMLNDEQVGSIKISMNLPSLLLEVYNELPDAKKSAVRFVN
ncbi:hypothetical protein BOX15_Mlig004133g2, partial [Macrostomum lignano]